MKNGEKWFVIGDFLKTFIYFILFFVEGDACEALVVVGHSLGGALATLFSYDLALRSTCS